MDEWENTADTRALVTLAGERGGTARKFRLLMAALVRDARGPTLPPVVEQTVALAERFADGWVERRRVDTAYAHLDDRWSGTELPLLLDDDGLLVDHTAAVCRRYDRSDADGRDRRNRFIREVFGNPFRPVTPDPGWVTPTVRGLAWGAYQTGRFDTLPVLADALEEAGCEVRPLLDHLRDPSATHVRGCWAVDVILGKS